MSNYYNQSPRFLITFIFFIIFYTFSSACTCPPPPPEPMDPECTTPPLFNITVCTANIIEVIFYNYTTFGSAPGEFCACGFNMPFEITDVQSVEIVDASTNNPLPEFSFSQNSTSAMSFNAIEPGNWEGFSSAVSGTISAGISINIIFTVVVSTCAQATIQNAISGLKTIGTAGATADGAIDNHECIPPPPILPIILNYFIGNSVEAGVQLSWETLSEINNDYFSIERSTNGKDFKEITRIQGTGNSNIPIEYTYIDKTPESGINYYRLKQNDLDGGFEYFNIVKVESLSKSPEIVVFPNPVQRGELNLHLPNLEKGDVVVKIYNCFGELEFTQSFQTNKIQLNTQQFSQGIYIVTVYLDKQIFYEQVVLT